MVALFLLKGSVLFAECDLECGAAPRCCQHWRRLFVILSDNLYNRYRCRTEPLSRQATVLFQASNLSSSEVSRLDFVLSESGRLFRASQFHQRDPLRNFPLKRAFKKFIVGGFCGKILTQIVDLLIHRFDLCFGVLCLLPCIVHL